MFYTRTSAFFPRKTLSLAVSGRLSPDCTANQQVTDMTESSSTGSKRAKAAADKATAELEARLESLRADMDEIMKALGDKAGKQAAEVKEAFTGNRAEEILDELREVLGDVKRRAGDAEKKVVETAREHPMQSLLVAFGVGFLASLLLRR